METYEEKYKDLVKRLNKARVKKGVYTFNSVLDAIAPELKIEESEDERIRKEIISLIKGIYQGSTTDSAKSERDKYVAWLEKQGEHVKFLNSIQVGDQVTRNEDGELFNLSQLKRVAKPAENKGKNNMGISEATKQKLEDNLNKALEKETPESWNKFLDDQKPVDKVEPKFKVGDKIKLTEEPKYPAREIIAIKNDAYYFDELVHLSFSHQDEWELVKQKPAWGEEDEKQVRQIKRIVHNDGCTQKLQKQIADWFNSLKDRYTWKPSDEQMNTLEQWLKDNRYNGDARYCYPIFESLYQDLLKLREE